MSCPCLHKLAENKTGTESGSNFRFRFCAWLIYCFLHRGMMDGDNMVPGANFDEKKTIAMQSSFWYEWRYRTF